MTDRKHCVGCYNDFYNNRGGCWHLPDAVLVRRIKIHRDAMPPFTGAMYEPDLVPNCWQGQDVSAYPENAITSDGRWT